MSRFDQLFDATFALVMRLVEITFTLFGLVEMWCRKELRLIGTPYAVQTLILVVLGGLAVIGLFRLLRGVLRAVAVVFVLLLALNILSPYLWR